MPPTTHAISVLSPRQAADWIFAHSAAEAVAVDLETTGLNPRRDRARLVALAVPGRDAVVADLLDATPAEVRLLLRPLERAPHGLLLHNAPFDLGFLWHLGLTEIPPVFDTLLCGQVLAAGNFFGGNSRAKMGLADMLLRHLHVQLDKALQKSDWSRRELTPAQYEYAAADVSHLHALRDRLAAEAARAGLTPTVELEMAALPAFVWLGQSGVGFDYESWCGIADTFQGLKVEQCGLLDDYLPQAPDALFPDWKLKPGSGRKVVGRKGLAHGWNWNSNDDVKEAFHQQGVLYDHFDDAVLAAIPPDAANGVGEFAATLRRYRDAHTKVSRYGRTWDQFVEADGRVYADWVQLGTDTGRTACRKPNLQQIPRYVPGQVEHRKCVVPAPGHVFVKCDVSQFQLRIATQQSRDSLLMEAYAKGRDIHTVTAAMLTGKPMEACTKADRQVAKSANFGLLFGMGWRGLKGYALAEFGLNYSDKEARTYHTKFFQAYPDLVRWHRACHQQWKWESRSRLGRRRLFRKPVSDTFRVNTPVQGDEADGMKLAMARLWERRREVGGVARPVLFVHDEIVLECEAAYAEPVARWVDALMVEAITPVLAPVPAVCDPKILTSWAE